jgi:hypothetical protein
MTLAPYLDELAKLRAEELRRQADRDRLAGQARVARRRATSRAAHAAAPGRRPAVVSEESA